MPEKILIVDDDVDTLKLVGLILQRQGYQIVAANGGTAALSKATIERPDLILLDLMMPDMDGYEVTRHLRSDPSLAQIPIIMFTAKTMLDDKVAGFEAGADDYLTKPTHPSELLAHVKALLARSQGARPAAPVPAPPPQEQARIVGVCATKGGVGVTTLALNFAAAAAQSGEDVIMVDLHPGSGSVGLNLSLTQVKSLSPLLTRPVSDINSRIISGHIISHPSNMRVLAAPVAPSEAGLLSNAAQVEATVRALATMCKLLVLDLGVVMNESARHILPLCTTLMVVADPTRLTVAPTKVLLSELDALGILAARTDVVMVNRTPSTVQMSWAKAEEALGRKISGIITPAVELAYQAVEAGTPITLMRPDSLTADQFRKIATQTLQKMRLASPA